MPAKKRYEVFHPDHETIVQGVLDIKNAINSRNFSDLFEQTGILEKDPSDWIPLQSTLDIFNTLEARGGAMMDFVAIGMKAGEDIPLPPEFNRLSFEEKLTAMASTHQLYHRGTDIGYAECRKVAAQHLLYVTRIPYPDDMLYGMIFALSKRFLPENTQFKLYYDEREARREKGGQRTIFHIEWWQKQ